MYVLDAHRGEFVECPSIDSVFSGQVGLEPHLYAGEYAWCTCRLRLVCLLSPWPQVP